MPAESDLAQPDLKTYVAPLRRRKWWIVWITLAGIVGSAAYAFTAPKEYTATVQLLVQPTNGTVTLGNTTQQTISPTDIATQIQLAESAPVVSAAQSSLKFKPKVSVAQSGTTDVITISATYSTGSQAANVANTYAKAFVTYQRQVAVQNLTTAELQLQQQINTINTELSTQSLNSPGAIALGNQEAVLKEELAQLQVYGASTSGGVELVSQATAPTSPSAPKKKTDIGIGFGAGLVVGLGIAYLVDAIDDAVYSRDDLERLMPGIPILGLIPLIASWRDKKTTFTVSTADPNSVVSEAYRSLRTSLQFASYDEPIKTILITSPTATEGKSSTVANLGVMFAKAGDRVVLLSTDLRRPRLGKFFNADESIGITSVVIGESNLDDAIHEVDEIPGLHILGSGPIPPNPSELLASRKMADLMEDLRSRFDVVIVDSPPILPVTDPVLLARLTDMTLMIVSAGQTKKGQVERAYEQLVQAGVRHMGIVLNEVGRDAGYGYAYNYGYRYSYKPTGEVPAKPVSKDPASTNGHAAENDSDREPTVTASRAPGKRRRFTRRRASH
ncbi:MAG: polysaccharide biosynthesis tyrosine autokinase [Acidimicrobiales bacterium]